jgi:hypothetical protein
MASNFLAALIALVAAVCSAVGTNLQKRAHTSNEKLPKDERKSYLALPLWWLGMLGVIGASVGDFIALGLGTQSLVTGLGGGATIVANVLVSAKGNDEPIYL